MRQCVALCWFAGQLLITHSVSAQPARPTSGSDLNDSSAEESPSSSEDSDLEPEEPRVSPATDTLGGHLALAAGLSLATPFGKLESNLAQADTMGSAWGLELDAGYGVSRTVVLGIWGQFLNFGSGGDSCSSCSATSFAGGAFVRYHLVQGVRFDPWMSAGLGFRRTSIDGLGNSTSYSGVEWLRLRVGGDWYAWDKLGFGPFMGLDMGIFSNKSSGEISDSAVHWHASVGARGVFDTPGK